MTNLALVLAAFSTLVALTCFAALVEMYKSLSELQKYVDYNDAAKSMPDETSALMGQLPSQHGLPARLDGEAFAAMLLLSPRCNTCARVATELAKGIPEGLTVVIGGAEESVARKWLQSVGLSPDEVIVDHDYRIINSMGLYTTPALLRIIDGRLAGAWTIPSYRALRSFLDEEPPAAVPRTLSAPQEHGGNVNVYATGQS